MTPTGETTAPLGDVPHRGGRLTTLGRYIVAFCVAFASVALMGTDAHASPEPELGNTTTAAVTFIWPSTGTAKVQAMCMDGSGNMRTAIASTVSATQGNSYTMAATACGAVGYTVMGYVVSYGANFWWSGSNGAHKSTWTINGGSLVWGWPLGITADLDAVPSSTCATFDDSSAADSEAVWRPRKRSVIVDWHWTGGTAASAGFRIVNMDTEAYVDETYSGNGLYTKTWAQQRQPSYVRIKVKGTPSCFIDLGVEVWGSQESLGTGAGGGPSDYGEADDPDSGSDCSAFDIFCRIKAGLSWAFVPEDESLEQFSALGDDIQTKIPFVYIAGTFTLLDFNLPDCTGGSCIGYEYDGLFTIPSFDLGGVASGGITVLGPGDDITLWMVDNRELMGVFVWLLMLVPLGLWIWRRLMPVAGSGSQ